MRGRWAKWSEEKVERWCARRVTGTRRVTASGSIYEEAPKIEHHRRRREHATATNVGAGNKSGPNTSRARKAVSITSSAHTLGTYIVVRVGLLKVDCRFASLRPLKVCAPSRPDPWHHCQYASIASCAGLLRNASRRNGTSWKEDC